MPFDPAKPYNDLPLLPPKTELETSGAEEGDRCEQGLAELKGAGGLGEKRYVR
jgi:cell filamentation protein, protein adenylyltransferase